MIIGQGSTTDTLSDERVQERLERALELLTADRREVIIYAPHGDEISYAHNRQPESFAAEALAAMLQGCGPHAVRRAT